MRMPAKSVTKAKAPTFAAVLNRPMGALDHNLNRRAGKAQPSLLLSRHARHEPLLGRAASVGSPDRSAFDRSHSVVRGVRGRGRLVRHFGRMRWVVRASEPE